MIGIVGLGQIGQKIASRMSESGEVLVLDADNERLKTVQATEKIQGTVADHMNELSKCDLFLTALPGSVAFATVKKLLSLGKPVVDISFFNEDPYQLDEIARSSNTLYIPDAGFAPGLSNIFAARLHEKHQAEEIYIYVGGLPFNPKPPFLHSVTWSAEGLIDEYTREARIIHNGEIKTVDPLDKITRATIGNLGEFEAFYSDGLRTLLKTVKVKEMAELTLRYSGHLQLMKILREMGYFNEAENNSPRKVSEAIFNNYRSVGEDFSMLEVRADKGEPISLVDTQKIEGETSMSRLTSLPAVVMAQGILDGRIEGKGLYEPELVAGNDSVYDQMLKALRDDGMSLSY